MMPCLKDGVFYATIKSGNQDSYVKFYICFDTAVPTDLGEALLPGLDWTGILIQHVLILSHTHPSAQAGFLKTL